MSVHALQPQRGLQVFSRALTSRLSSEASSHTQRLRSVLLMVGFDLRGFDVPVVFAPVAEQLTG